MTTLQTWTGPLEIAYALQYDAKPETVEEWHLYEALLDALPPTCWPRVKARRPVFLVPASCVPAVEALLPADLAGAEETQGELAL